MCGSLRLGENWFSQENEHRPYVQTPAAAGRRVKHQQASASDLAGERPQSSGQSRPADTYEDLDRALQETHGPEHAALLDTRFLQTRGRYRRKKVLRNQVINANRAPEKTRDLSSAGALVLRFSRSEGNGSRKRTRAVPLMPAGFVKRSESDSEVFKSAGDEHGAMNLVTHEDEDLRKEDPDT